MIKMAQKKFFSHPQGMMAIIRIIESYKFEFFNFLLNFVANYEVEIKCSSDLEVHQLKIVFDEKIAYRLTLLVFPR